MEYDRHTLCHGSQDLAHFRTPFESLGVMGGGGERGGGGGGGGAREGRRNRKTFRVLGVGFRV